MLRDPGQTVALDDGVDRVLHLLFPPHIVIRIFDKTVASVQVA